MRGLWTLSLRHVLHHKVQTGILVFCIALAVFTPVTVHVLTDRYESDLVARGDATPQVLGARGNRFDLTLAALYFRQAPLQTIPQSELDEIRGSELATAIPLHVRFSAREYPIVGTSPEYYDLRGLTPVRGDLPLRLGDAVLGAAVAEALELAPGDTLFSSPTDIYDISKPPALELRIAGVLPTTGTPDDVAVFVDVKTCWILEGLAHGHDDAAEIDEEMVLGETDNVVNVNPALRSFQRITPDNVDSFHFHGDPGDLPLSAVLVVPHDRKSATILVGRYHNDRLWQLVVPRAVIDDLMQVVFRIRALLDTFAVLLAITTAFLLGLQILLSMRLRAREMATLHRIGCSRFTVAGLYATEVAVIVVLGVALASAGVTIAVFATPDLIRSL